MSKSSKNIASKESFSFLFLSISIVVIDQLLKFIVLKNLNVGESIYIIKNIFHITLVLNTGTAFGILKNMTLFFIIVSICAIVFIIYNIFIKPSNGKSKREIFALYLILAGAIGNLIDRIRFGYVIDFLDFRIWPVFNIADSAITCGAILLAISLFRANKNKNM